MILEEVEDDLIEQCGVDTRHDPQERWLEAVKRRLRDDLVRKLFIKEPGVLIIGDESSPGTRRYRTLRIPESVVVRVYRRLCN